MHQDLLDARRMRALGRTQPDEAYQSGRPAAAWQSMNRDDVHVAGGLLLGSDGLLYGFAFDPPHLERRAVNAQRPRSSSLLLVSIERVTARLQAIYGCAAPASGPRPPSSPHFALITRRTLLVAPRSLSSAQVSCERRRSHADLLGRC
jgi:hypothetical protein